MTNVVIGKETAVTHYDPEEGDVRSSLSFVGFSFLLSVPRHGYRVVLFLSCSIMLAGQPQLMIAFCKLFMSARPAPCCELSGAAFSSLLTKVPCGGSLTRVGRGWGRGDGADSGGGS